MTPEILKILLTKQGIIFDDTNYDQTFHIRSLNFNSHGNFYVDPLGTWLRFDFTNNLIRVKEYDYRVISSRFSENYDVDGTMLITGLKPAMFHNKYQFRRPKVGDVIFFVSKKDNKRHDVVAEIVSIQTSNGKVVFSTDAGLNDIDPSKYYACYADGEHFDVVQSDTDLITEYENDATLLFWHRPKTNFTTDLYFDINNLVSINVC